VWRLNDACFNKALQILARRDHSCSELGKKLHERGFPEKETRDTINACVRLGYLDDERFADAYLLQLQRKGNGINSIKHKLHSKGISGEIISNCVAIHCSDDIQLNACRQVLLKKMKSIKSNKKIKDTRPKLQRFLLSRGFSNRIIYQALEEATGR
jgi:regulatory protein